MKGFALYKGSNSDHIEQISGEVFCTDGACSVSPNAFVIAPFNGTEYFIVNQGTGTWFTSEPSLAVNHVNQGTGTWFTPEPSLAVNHVNQGTGTWFTPEPSLAVNHVPVPWFTYSDAFSKFHTALKTGTFSKLVLSRRKFLPGKIDIFQSFHTACSLYPDQNIILFSTPPTGTWLIVTPELLLEMNGENGTTMALAGTKKGDRPWTPKERREQSLVADYIEERLNALSDNVMRHATEDAQAADLTHLRTRFNFRTEKSWHEVARRLHPTPAVCGLPADEAKAFILSNEGYDRRFYSGYCGPVSPHSCRLLVTLRCAEICSDGCWLYAGGGILPESDEQSEWQETENKMQTIIKAL